MDGVPGAALQRRGCLRRMVAGALPVLVPRALPTLVGGLAAAAAAPARAGAQIEEPLSDAVRHALRAAVEQLDPPEPVFATPEARLAYVHWLTRASWQLRRRKPEPQARLDFLQTVWYESRRAGLDTALVLGLIEVESAFRKYAISRAGARGYMQVMPFWTRLIGDGDPDKLFHLQTNLRYGCVILRHYLDRERGDLFLALGRYNGSRGRAAYPNAVFAAERRWRLA
ncbi:Membrane-bound lytic murein transglycosylase C [Tepidimonas thermarum]|uniref:Membrane-bound lytic murein transglycosylase C n=1 Tax=Tepidimonas thermarum TaxID=335431 RepID=A0A554X6Q0_9BURK|nr:lytic transglycosylase domain-containing protein [Tepidimonas thermarum]TSE31436.1 Membrane-bound lytic murein transglycosylase C [Tepidimonas thermarum]